MFVASHLSPNGHLPLDWQVNCAPNQAPSDEEVVHRNDEKGDYIEYKKRRHGVDFGVQVSCVGIWGACFKGFIGLCEVKGMQVRENGFGDGQNHGQEPNSRSFQTDLSCGVGRWDIHGFHNGFISETEGEFYSTVTRK